MKNFFLRLICCLIPIKNWRVQFREKYIRIPLVNYGTKFIYGGEDGQEVILNELNKNKPSLICRFGGTEMRVVAHYLKHMRQNSVKFPEKIKEMIGALSGFFPSNDYLLSRFSSEFINLTKDIDVLAVWNTKSEKLMCEKYVNTDAKLIHLSVLDTVNYQNPWSQYLKGKKVLVIHPFAKTIEEQYQKRELLFKNPKTLPEFELITMKPVQGLADSRFDLPYNNWFEALKEMEDKIDKIDFDIAIVAAGAYGIFLAHHCKMIGKQAVHMAGVTQLLFGITGKRWETESKYVIADCFNEHWVRPSEDEKPKGLNKVESGCYW